MSHHTSLLSSARSPDWISAASVASSSHTRPPGGAGWELTGCGAVAWGAWRKGHIGGAAGGVVGVSSEVGSQEGRAQDSGVVRRSWLDPQHTGCAGNLQHRSQTCVMTVKESAENVQRGVNGVS